MLTLLLAVQACLPVAGDRITFGDLSAAIPAFLGLDPTEPIGFAPAPGATRRYSPGELDRLAARKGIAMQSGPVCFEREMETLTRDGVIAALRESLPEGSQLELVEFSQARIPKGTLEFPRGGLAPARVGSPRDAVIWRGRVKYAARQSVPVWAKTRAWISRPGLVADRDLPSSVPIGAHQIRIASVDVSPFSTGAAISPGDVVGLSPRRPILSGHVISRVILEAPNEVSRGEMVGVEAHYGSASVRFEARAELAGRVGDRIPVRNMGSGKTFRARVVRKGLVTVE